MPDGQSWILNPIKAWQSWLRDPTFEASLRSLGRGTRFDVPPTSVTSYGRQVLEQAGAPIPTGATFAPGAAPSPAPTVAGGIAERGLTGLPGGQSAGGPPLEEGYGTWAEAEAAARARGPGWYADEIVGEKGIRTGRFTIFRDPRWFGPPKQLDGGPRELSVGEAVKLGLTREQMQEQARQDEANRALREQQLEEQRRAAGAEEAYRQSQLAAQLGISERELAWQREQEGMRQAEMERQYRARLSAQPRSWLEYAAYTGETPAVQPWMLPLSPQQYGWQAGQQLPGWMAQQTGREEATRQAGLTELTRPSMQYFARIAPSAQQQYLGYEQARTGARPEDIMWQQRATAPPGGASPGLRWLR